MTYKEEFIRFMTECGVLTFGDFTLKSGRKAPYFINTGNYKTGAQLCRLGEYYAHCITEHGLKADVLFGPAYKGIPLAAAAAIALYKEHGVEVGYAYDRKEVKDHGEGGMIVGSKLEAGTRVVLIEDVMTSGKALREVYPKLKSVADVDITGMIITVDRQEKGLNSEKSAVQEVKAEFGVDVYSIVTVSDIIAAIESGVVDGKAYLPQMLAYREQYGV
ncbi:MAG: orotate phosphoribosyltransferase [Oscillospiraceae bacterium]|nr:orotate phosphoribosyltransferase [Oscillospiraceae bacterium]